MTAPSKTPTFDSLFRQSTSKKALKTYDSAADVPEKVEKTSHDNLGRIGPGLGPGPAFGPGPGLFPGFEKLKKSNFQLPKGPCGHDTRKKGLAKIEKVKFAPGTQGVEPVRSSGYD